MKKKPTINCLKHLQHVTEELSKQKLHFVYLEQCNLLDALRDWIHPLPDKSLPAAKIREEMYRIINKLELHKYELTDYLLEIMKEQKMKMIEIVVVIQNMIKWN